MKIKNHDREYEIGKQVAETRNYRLYLCREISTNTECLFQIATNVAHNGSFDHVVFLLKQLKQMANEIEKQYEAVKTNKEDMLNYDFGFPILIDYFTADESQGFRRINILGFKAVDLVSQMVPIGNIINKDQLRVDLRTSVWILGKLMKILVFTQNQGIAIGRLDINNVLIEPDQHYVSIFDWSLSTIASETNQVTEVQKAAKIVIELLGGNYETDFFPDSNEELKEYTDLLIDLANGEYKNAKTAHTKIYKVVDEIWPRAFYPFTAYPKN